MAVTANVPKRFSSLIIELPVQQAGSGDPSPDNIRPIAQWTDVELYVAETDTATEPTLTTTLPTSIFGGMVDVARGEVASLYNEKKSSSGWEMVEEGQFRCQVGAFNNGDETSTNVADLYSSHYKTVSNKDAYEATDDLTCGTPTIEGVTYLYVNDLDYTTLEAFTAYIGDVQFVYKSHIPMSDEIAPTIVYLPEGTSYVWATASYEILTVTGTPPLELPNAAPRPVEQFEVSFTPVQDLHGYDSPWPAGGGKNKLNIDQTLMETSGWDALFPFTIAEGSYTMSCLQRFGPSGTYGCKVSLCDSSKTAISVLQDNFDFGYNNVNRSITFSVSSSDASSVAYIKLAFRASGITFDELRDAELQIEIGSTFSDWSPYSNICPITGWTGCEVYAEQTYDPSADPKATVNFGTLSANQWDEEWEVGTINNTTGVPSPDPQNIRSKNYIPVTPNESYYFYKSTSIANLRYYWYDVNYGFIDGGVVSNVAETAPSNAHYLKIRTTGEYGDTFNHDFCVNYPSNVTTYNPYRNYSYGGTADVVGGSGSEAYAEVVAKDLAWVKSASQTNPSGTYFEVINASVPFIGWGNGGRDNAKCNVFARASLTGASTNEAANTFWWNTGRTGYRCIWGIPNGGSTLEEFTQFLTDNSVVFVGELSTPTPFTFTPTTLSTSQGDNYAWSDTNGNTMTVSYWGKEQ